MDYIIFWLSKVIIKLMVFVSFVVIVFVCLYIPELIKRFKCKHETYHETMAGDAVCNKCGKNLGFIGNLRDKNSNGV